MPARSSSSSTRQHIPYRIGGQGSQILVPADQVAAARVLLAKEGLPSGGSIGYEIFDRGDGLAATEFQQKINETRALEGELARTIRAISGVRAARVHLVLPRREPFAREQQDAQASVMLTMAGAARLDREGVQAILNLVAAAVPGLRPQNIAIVDCARRSAGARRRRRSAPLPRPCPPRKCGAPPNCGCRARWRRCWSAASAPATCAPRRRCA